MRDKENTAFLIQNCFLLAFVVCFDQFADFSVCSTGSHFDHVLFRMNNKQWTVCILCHLGEI